MNEDCHPFVFEQIWPHTIAVTYDPDTNGDVADGVELGAFDMANKC
jgi:hypothetical protein